MSLRGYQNALAGLIASPERCLAVRSDPEAALAGFELDARERRRLATIVWQPGMSVSCSLYRVNRITPIYSLLPLSCKLLGARLVPLAERYWELDRRSDLQFGHEVERFAAFLRQEMGAAGPAPSPFLAEVLDFELAVNRLRYLPRKELLEEIERAADGEPRIHPLAAVVSFRADPAALLPALAEDRRLPEPSGDRHYLALDGTGEEVELAALPAALGEAAVQLAGGGTPAPVPLGRLCALGLVVRAPRPLPSEP